MEEHLTLVTKERSYLRSIIEDTRHQIPEDQQLFKHQVNLYDGLANYSFDFAQQLQFLSNPLQPRLIYFKGPRKCSLFGVNCELSSDRSTISWIRVFVLGKVLTASYHFCIISLKILGLEKSTFICRQIIVPGRTRILLCCITFCGV